VRMTAMAKSITFLIENYSTSSDSDNRDKQKSGLGVTIWMWKTNEEETKQSPSSDDKALGYSKCTRKKEMKREQSTCSDGQKH